MKAKDLVGTEITARIKLHNYRYPRRVSDHQSGDFAIINCDVLEVYDGTIPEDANIATLPMFATVNPYYPIITATGPLQKMTPNGEYIFKGTLSINEKYGPQYKLVSMRLNYDMSNVKDQKKFLKFFMSDHQIELLYQNYANPIELLDQKNIGELITIKGIGRVTAAKMCARYEECKDKSRAYVVLADLGLTKHAIDKIVEHYGSADKAVEVIELNPYILINEVRGYGWKKADAIALKKGFTKDCKERVIAYTQYYLEYQAETNGNSWVGIEDLLVNVSNECAPVTKENLTAWIKEVMTDEDGFNRFYAKHLENKFIELPALLYYDRKDRRVGLFSLRLLEKNISRHFARLKNAPACFTYDKSVCEQIIKEIEAEQKFEYTEEQRNAIYDILDNNVAVLSGGAGTGKTTTIKAITRILAHYSQRVDLCALSGKASSLLNELTGASGKTIHRLLAYNVEREQFAYNDKVKMPGDVIILDETSMVGGELFLSLIQAIKDGAKFIMLGDFHQLEAIGFCNILKDSMYSGYIKTIILTKIHRQAARSGIVTQSMRISCGETLVKNDFLGEEIRGDLKDFKIVCSMDSSLLQMKLIKEYKDLYEGRHIPLTDIQVIAPMRTRGGLSCRSLNPLIQNLVNGKTYFNEVYVDCIENGTKFTTCFKPNDRIIITRNNYHALGLDGHEKPIFNGNVGYIKDIVDDQMIVTLREHGDVIIPREDWDDIQLGYCISIHKSQGATIPYVVMALDSSAYALLSKELVYTGITRASKYCVLLTQPKIVNMAARISRVRTKQTWLSKDLHELFIKEVEKEK